MELRRVCESNEHDDLDRKESAVEEISSGKKNGAQKDIGHSILNSVSRIVSQIKKPAHRRSGSPLNWFPRKKADSYLKRKIRFLQENEGMNLSLDETLGNANPHYTRMAREKIAAREAARKAMAARKVAMVEASWCRILRAARIQSKEAEVELEKAEKLAAEAFEAARAKGVTMYDRPDSPRKSCEVQSCSSLGGRSTHMVTASFETAFEVDKEVMAAVKEAFIQFAKCPPPSNKQEFKDLIWKISQNPDNGETDQGLSEISSESFTELVDAMLNRLKGLEEDQLSSLVTIVATCGLNAALIKIEHSKDHEQGATGPRRISSAARFIDGFSNRKESVTEIPSLDKFLVKHVSRLEREVQEARKSNCQKTQDAELKPATPSEPISDLGSILVKHVSKLEKEVQEARNSHKKNLASEKVCKGLRNDEIPSTNRQKTAELDETITSYECNENADSNTLAHTLEQNHTESLPVKHLSRLERAKLEVLNSFASHEQCSLDKILVKPEHRLERKKLQALGTENTPILIIKKRNPQTENIESLDAILVKHQSKLEKDKADASQQPLYENIKNRKHGNEPSGSESLDKILVRHPPELEEAKLAAAPNSEDCIKLADARKEAREKELQEAWGGLSLGNSMRPHLSRLERDRAAWKRAEEEERKHARGKL